MKKRIIYSLLSFGLTALIGVGAFIGLRKEPIKETMAIEAPKKYAKITPSADSPLVSTKTYYFIAKNYESDGEGIYYQNSINLTNSAICSHLSNSNSQAFYGEFDLVNNDGLTRTRLYFTTMLDGGVYKLNSVFLATITNGVQSNSVYMYYCDPNSGSFRRQYCGFVLTNFDRVQYPTQSSVYYATLNQFFNIYDLDNYAMSYDFNKAFNYNNFYQVLDTFFAQPYNAVVGATTGNTNWEKTYNVGMFYSGGLVFDTIKVYFNRNSGSYFETGPNSKEYKTYYVDAVNASNYYFYKMDYLNTATNFSITACNRTSFQQGNNSYIEFLPAWSNQEFKNLQFQKEISSLFIRSVFNSLSDTEQLNKPTQNPDIGLSNAFSLIGTAFTAWLPILNVSVIPGITLGTLIFLPLIAGIIILIIWIVKR